MSKKLFYRIGEACKQLDIQPYVLRYWETEFPVLSPRKSKAGQRVYSEEELRLIQRIKQLLYEEGYTIAGAKKKLEAEIAGNGVPATTAEPEPPAGSRGAGRGRSAAATADARTPRGESAPGAATAVIEEEATTEGNGVVTPHETSANAPPASLDSPAGQQVERLRTGLQEALAEAREILRLLSA